MRNKTWITGLGAVTPLGNDFATFSERVLSGRTAIGPANELDNQGNPFIAAQVPCLPIPSGFNEAEIEARGPLDRLALWCVVQAMRDAGLWENRSRLRVGLVLGIGGEWNRIWEFDAHRGGKRIQTPAGDVEPLVNRLQRELGLAGPVLTVAAACASANYAFAVGKRWLESGWADVCVAGGCDLTTPMSFGGFNNLRALSRRAGDPARASRPFDIDRDGFVLGEGGGAFVLEPETSARARNAQVYGELAGFGCSSDAFHMVIPSDEPQPAATAMRLALADAQINPDEVDYVNAHATSTPVGDKAESKALQLVFGDSTSRVAVSSTKSMTGHLLSAAAAVEAMACLAAFREQAVPPTVNLDRPDPECRLCHVPHAAREQSVRVAISNSFGFGGSNTCAVFRKAG